MSQPSEPRNLKPRTLEPRTLEPLLELTPWCGVDPSGVVVGARRALIVREPAAVYDSEAEPAVSRQPEEEESYSIRLPDPAARVACARCGTRFSAAGPTGHAGDRPICDLCLLERSPKLGMVLALVAVVRSFAVYRPSSHEEYHEALAEIGAFARIYERFAAKSGPARVFRIPSFDPR